VLEEVLSGALPRCNILMKSILTSRYTRLSHA
jgi:hypothetical protein